MSLFKKDKKIPVVIITGYLGSGKTTFLNQLLLQEKRKVAVVVNDMGEINVDASLIKAESAKKLDTKMVELSNGCICCTLRDEFMTEVAKLAKIKDLEGIFVEASGISEPSSIAEAFLAYQEMNNNVPFYISSIVTVVDADRIYTEFLDNLEDKIEAINNETDEEEDPDIINLVMDQIEFCDCIVLNKCDLLTSDKILEVRDVIRKLQHEAEIIESINGKVNADRILNGKRFDYDKAMNSSFIQKALKRSEAGEKCVDEYGVSSFVFEEKRPFDRDKFMDFLEKNSQKELLEARDTSGLRMTQCMFSLWRVLEEMHQLLNFQTG